MLSPSPCQRLRPITASSRAQATATTLVAGLIITSITTTTTTTTGTRMMTMAGAVRAVREKRAAKAVKAAGTVRSVRTAGVARTVEAPGAVRETGATSNASYAEGSVLQYLLGSTRRGGGDAASTGASSFACIFVEVSSPLTT